MKGRTKARGEYPLRPASVLRSWSVYAAAPDLVVIRPGQNDDAPMNIGATGAAGTGTGPGATTASGKTVLAGVAAWLADFQGAQLLEIDRIILRRDHAELWARKQLPRMGTRWEHFHKHLRVRVESQDCSSMLASGFRDFESFSVSVRYCGRAAMGFPEVYPDPGETFRELNNRIVADVMSKDAQPDAGASVLVVIRPGSMRIWRGQDVTRHPLPTWWSDILERIAPWTESRNISISGTIKWLSAHRRAEIARERRSVR